MGNRVYVGVLPVDFQLGLARMQLPSHKHPRVGENSFNHSIGGGAKNEEIRGMKGETLHQRALEGRERKLGPKHSDTPLYISGLAYVLQRQKQYEDAGKLYQQACGGLQQKLGLHHPKTIVCLINPFSPMQQQELEDLYGTATST